MAGDGKCDWFSDTLNLCNASLNKVILTFQGVALREAFELKMTQKMKQAGAELCQAQSKLELVWL